MSRAMPGNARLRASLGGHRSAESRRLEKEADVALLQPAPLAPWLADPSLLPKRPPTRAERIAETEARIQADIDARIAAQNEDRQ